PRVPRARRLVGDRAGRRRAARGRRGARAGAPRRGVRDLRRPGRGGRDLPAPGGAPAGRTRALPPRRGRAPGGRRRPGARAVRAEPGGVPTGGAAALRPLGGGGTRRVGRRRGAKVPGRTAERGRGTPARGDGHGPAALAPRLPGTVAPTDGANVTSVGLV